MKAPPQSCDRRGFLVRTAALLGAGVTAACEKGPLSPLVGGDGEGRDGAPSLHGSGAFHVYANESGEFASREPFVVGVLLADDPDTHEPALAALRDGYLRELSYGNSDRLKEDYAVAAMDHFFGSEGLAFAAVATNAGRSAGGVDATGLYVELLRSLGGNGGGVSFHMERRFFDPAPDDALEMRLEGIPGVDVEFIPSQDSELLQLGDLLTGSVRGDMARKAKGRSNPRGNSPHGNVKDRLIARLKELLNVQRLAHPSLARREKFSVEVLHPPF